MGTQHINKGYCHMATGILNSHYMYNMPFLLHGIHMNAAMEKQWHSYEYQMQIILYCITLHPLDGCVAFRAGIEFLAFFLAQPVTHCLTLGKSLILSASVCKTAIIIITCHNRVL